MTNDPPPPGSDEAVRLGCLCPVMDNYYGRGFEIEGQRSYWYDLACKVHAAGMPGARSLEIAESVPDVDESQS